MSGVPKYQQIVRQVEHALRMGQARPGERLPKVKDVATGLAINSNTVLKAYRELRMKGLVVAHAGVGTFVERTLEVVSADDQHTLRQGLSRWLEQAADSGLDDSGISALFSAALHEHLKTDKGDR
jgi:GntR family transcriptional regulator